jgi:hypothetical protein
MALSGRAVLEQAGRADELRGRLHEILSDANEDPPRFQATSSYVVATMRRGAA